MLKYQFIQSMLSLCEVLRLRWVYACTPLPTKPSRAFTLVLDREYDTM